MPNDGLGVCVILPPQNWILEGQGTFGLGFPYRLSTETRVVTNKDALYRRERGVPLSQKLFFTNAP